MNHLRLAVITSFLSLTASLAACAPAQGDVADGDEELDTKPTSSPIIAGTTASAYPEAVLLDMYTAGSSWPSSICSASVIAPRVVLTAGHCVEGFARWRVKAPFAGNQSANASSGATYDWAGVTGGTVDPRRHDVGLVFLDTPITLSSYPSVASTGSADGTKIVNIGRIDDGVASNTSLFVGASVSISSGSRIGHPYAYYSTEIIQSGDSGGPDVIPGTTPHKIIAVNSGAGGGTQVLARVDLVYSWIDTQVKAHGGWPSSTTPTPTPTPMPPPSSCTANESEPNDAHTSPDPLANGTNCGALTASNQDWYSWSVGSTAVNYAIELKASGDANIQMWKLVSGQYYKVANTTATTFTKTSNGAGTYVLVVTSGSGAAQSYTLSLKR